MIEMILLSRKKTKHKASEAKKLRTSW